jgi:hypothetical protein
MQEGATFERINKASHTAHIFRVRVIRRNNTFEY